MDEQAAIKIMQAEAARLGMIMGEDLARQLMPTGWVIPADGATPEDALRNKGREAIRAFMRLYGFEAPS